MSIRFVPIRFIAVAAAAVALAGCSGSVREHVRGRDFRNTAVETGPQAAPSPIANVSDMPGWSTDLGSALEFARENGRRTAILIVQPGHPASERARQVMTRAAVESALGQDLRVVLDIDKSGFEAGRLKVDDAPALVIMDSAGNAVGRRVGPLSEKIALAAIRE